ncbi:MAG: hypothetical protein WCX47_04095 [Bacilli bacterium]
MKKTLLYIPLLAGLLAVSSCTPLGPGTSNPTSYGVETVEKINPELYKSGNNFPLIRRNQGYHDLGSLGEKEVLIIPTEFEDALAEDLPGGAEHIRSEIEKTFFGVGGEDLPWESLSSFYQKSSYGQLTITGEVTDWWNTGYTVAELSAKGGGTATKILVSEALAWYKGIHGEASTQRFDKDGDGYVDAIYFVYSVPIGGDPENEVDDDMFWAFVYWTSDSPRVESPNGHNYMWASWEFMYEMGRYLPNGTYLDWTNTEIASGLAKVDAHTFIHESGHLLGLEDYYTYDNTDTTDGLTGTDYGALGGLDMMDYNIGDHNAWSKWILGWATPYWVKDSATITLKPFATSGESIMLAGPEYAYEHLSEYIMLEYVTPEGVAEYDGEKKFSGAYPLFYNEPGLQVIHVDARLAKYVYRSDTYQFSKYATISTAPNWGTSYTGLAHSNTASRNDAKANYKLVSLIESSGVNSLAEEIDVEFSNGTESSGYYNRASNESLFHVGDSFGINTYQDYMLHSGSPLGFTFEVLAMNESGVTIQITKLPVAE